MQAHSFLPPPAPCRWAAVSPCDLHMRCEGCRCCSTFPLPDHTAPRCSRHRWHRRFSPPTTSTLPAGNSVAVWLRRTVPRLPVVTHPGLVLTLSVLSLPLWPVGFAPGVAARLTRTAETNMSITEIVLRSALAPWEVFCRFFIRGFSSLACGD